MADHVDLVLAQWALERPDVDASPMAVLGRLKRLSLLVDGELRKTFREAGLDAASFDVLATLRRNGAPYSLTPAALMKSAMVTSGAITQRLDRLEGQGLVTRRPSGEDGRSVVVSLTDSGLLLIDETLPHHLATEERLLAALSPHQRDALAATLRRMLRSLGDEPGGAAPT